MEGEVWDKKQLVDLFVIIPTCVVLMFRVSKNPSELKVQDLCEFLLQPTGNFFKVPYFRDTLFYKDAPLYPDTNVLTFGSNITFLLEERTYQLEHSGLLWTCSKCKP